MVAVVGGNALHYVKRDGKMSGRGMSWGNMSEGGNVQGESPTLGQLCRSTGHTPVPSSCLRRDKRALEADVHCPVVLTTRQ